MPQTAEWHPAESGEDVLRLVADRAQAGLGTDPGAIDISCEEAWAILAQQPAAQLVDVRTAAEWNFVGVPDLATLGREVVALSWRQSPNFSLNVDFAAQLAQRLPDPSTPLLFLCRTGGRSLDAALAMRTNGYTSCFNIAHGFEGDLDAEHHRGGRNGWKAIGLPWTQS